MNYTLLRGFLPLFAGVLVSFGSIAFGAPAAEAEASPANPAEAAEAAHPPRGERGMRGPGMQSAFNTGNWLARFLAKPENLDKIGVEGEKRSHLEKGITEINAKMRELGDSIRAKSIEQGKIMRSILEKPGEDIAPILEKTKEIGALRTEQAMLSTRTLALLRDTLTTDQRDQVRELVQKEGRQRFEARREFNENMERRRPEFRHRGMRRKPQGENSPGDKAEPASEK